MKLTTIFIEISVLIMIIVLLSCSNNYKNDSSHDNSEVKTTKMKDNPYQVLRNKALNVTADQLQLHDLDDNDLYGIIMDWNMGDVIVTVVSFKTGDASIYLSTGQAWIGGYAHEDIAKSAKEFLNAGKKYLYKATKASTTQPSNEGKVNFYFLTKSGKYYLEDDIKQIENDKSDLTPLFSAGNQVITEYRLISDNK